jgi:hypothetical protein
MLGREESLPELPSAKGGFFTRTLDTGAKGDEIVSQGEPISDKGGRPKPLELTGLRTLLGGGPGRNFLVEGRMVFAASESRKLFGEAISPSEARYKERLQVLADRRLEGGLG